MARLALTMLLLALAAGCGQGANLPASPSSSASPAPPAPVKVEIAAAVVTARTLSGVGVLATLDSVEIRPEVAGLVESVLFADGDRVRRGQALVRLRDADARAGLLEAESRAKLAVLALDRARELAAKGDIAPAEVDRAEADAGLARAAVARAEEALRRTTLAAPFDGVVGKRGVSRGQSLDPSRVIARIEALDALVVDVALPESALSVVAPDQAARVTVEALHLDVAGTVRFVSPRVADNSRTVELRVGLDVTDPRLRPGMTASVEVEAVAPAPSISVPSQALVPGAAGMGLWVVDDGDVVNLKPVVTGERTAERVEIVSGIAAGDRVVVEGLSRLRPGASVTVVGTPASAVVPPAVSTVP